MNFNQDPDFLPDEPGSWRLYAACESVDDLTKDYFVMGSRAAKNTALEICTECEILDVCREYALANDVRGVWGGTTDADRRKIIKNREDKVGLNDSEAEARTEIEETRAKLGAVAIKASA